MRKFLLSVIAVLGLLMSIGGLWIAGIVLIVLAVLFWPGKPKEKTSKKEQNEPIWESNDRQSLYFEGDSNASSGNEAEF